MMVHYIVCYPQILILYPAAAKSDGANMLALDRLEGLLERLTVIRKAIAPMPLL